LVLHIQSSEKVSFPSRKKEQRKGETHDVRRARTERRASTSEDGSQISSLELVDVNVCSSSSETKDDKVSLELRFPLSNNQAAPSPKLDAKEKKETYKEESILQS